MAAADHDDVETVRAAHGGGNVWARGPSVKGNDNDQKHRATSANESAAEGKRVSGLECGEYLVENGATPNERIDSTVPLTRAEIRAASPEVIAEIMRESEAYLHAQVSLATSADQRATVMASVYVATAATIGAALLTLLSAEVSLPRSLFIAGGVSCAMFVVAAGFCVRTMLPIKFRVPGNYLSRWEQDIRTGCPISESFCDVVSNYEKRIAKNNKALRRNARSFRIGAIIGVVTPLIGVMVYVLAEIW